MPSIDDIQHIQVAEHSTNISANLVSTIIYSIPSGQSSYQRQIYRGKYDASFVHDDYADAYEGARRQLPPSRKTQRPHGRPSAARRGYQDKRVSRFRTEKSHATEQDLSTELHKKLFPGFKTGQNAWRRTTSHE
ncbi:hypothetical protein CBL_10018 [Carabus blaptoides fortunei]